LVHLEPNHFVAILAIDGEKVTLHDSLRGKHQATLSDFADRWSGKGIVFDVSAGLKPLSVQVAMATVGGCCGQAEEPECLGSSECDCNQPFTGPGAGGPGAFGPPGG
ncbi:MAG: hypothetical protein GTN93_34880, partial [Anaerolineae bacterium]|nr:hypothetical protein [Anaerolineae bacterium]